MLVSKFSCTLCFCDDIYYMIYKKLIVSLLTMIFNLSLDADNLTGE